MEKRQAGEMTTLETRGEAQEKVDKKKRYSQIIECLKECPEMTAKECAVMMMQKGYIPTSERNFTAPRLTEMSYQGIVEPVGKKVCEYTGHKVAVYALRDGQMDIFEV
jgi:hypothetical protein